MHSFNLRSYAHVSIIHSAFQLVSIINGVVAIWTLLWQMLWLVLKHRRHIILTGAMEKCIDIGGGEGSDDRDGCACSCSGTGIDGTGDIRPGARGRGAAVDGGVGGVVSWAPTVADSSGKNFDGKSKDCVEGSEGGKGRCGEDVQERREGHQSVSPKQFGLAALPRGLPCPLC